MLMAQDIFLELIHLTPELLNVVKAHLKQSWVLCVIEINIRFHWKKVHIKINYRKRNQGNKTSRENIFSSKIVLLSAFHHLHQTVSQFVTLSCRKTTTCNKTKPKQRNASGSHGEFQAVHGHIPTQLFLAFLVRLGEGDYAPQSALTPPTKKSM